MLVLSRKLDQSIVLGENIVISVLGIEGGRVRLGISAPADVPIRRAELEPHNRRNGAASAQISASHSVPLTVAVCR
ncbi:MAG: carbon storage regulator [Planctomycetes bacterium]|nr:carbon storage regulator [Planctomycetota bacterium]